MTKEWIEWLRKRGVHRMFKRYFWLAVVGFGASVVFLATAALIALKQGAVLPIGREALNAVVVFGGAMTLWVYVVRLLVELRGRLNWLNKQAMWSRDRLQTYGLHLTPEVRAEIAQRSETHWPWGSHHTELLGHLEAAARKWWQLYDPASPDTAPTNDMVSEWLIVERSVSKDKAKAIASILRADGLRTGPR